MGSAHRGDPELEGVFGSLVLDAQCYAYNGTVDEFADEMGYDMYDEDEAQKAREIYLACKVSWRKLRSLLGPLMDDALDTVEE